MSNGEILDALIKEGKELKARIQNSSDAGHVLGSRFIELGKALSSGGKLPDDFPFEYCDVAGARQIIRDLPRLREQMQNVEARIKSRTSLD